MNTNWKEAIRKALRELNWTQVLFEIAECLFYIGTCLAAYRVLVYVDILNDVSYGLMFAAWAVTFVVTDYAIARHDAFLFRRRIMKTAREVAKYKGIDPKKLNFKDIKITLGDDGFMDIDIGIDEDVKPKSKKK